MDNVVKLKIFALFFLVLIALSCRSQETTSRFLREQGGEFHLLDRIIGHYADSLNYWEPDMNLPNYLFDKDFDFNHRNYLSRLNTDRSRKWLLSLRMAIFMRIYNKEALQCVIEQKDERLDNIYDPKEHYQYPDISSPYSGPGPNIFWMELSTRGLAKFRLEEIRKKEMKFDSIH